MTAHGGDAELRPAPPGDAHGPGPSVYVAIVVLLTVVLPLLSIVADAAMTTAADLPGLVGRWFVFWGAGVRLLLAGVAQVRRPAQTAVGILKIRDPAAGKLVVELGSANIGMGLIGILSLANPAWLPPAAIAGGFFLGAAGVKHALSGDRNIKENVALATDLLVAAAVIVYLASRIV